MRAKTTVTAPGLDVFIETKTHTHTRMQRRKHKFEFLVQTAVSTECKGVGKLQTATEVEAVEHSACNGQQGATPLVLDST